MKKALTLCFTLSLFCFSNKLYSQKSKIKSNPFEVVKLPDTVKVGIVNYYLNKENRKDINIKTGMYVFNLLKRKDFVFKNGIYSFKLMGPHFPRMIFIHDNNKTYVFDKSGSFDPIGLLEEYLICIKELQLPEIKVRKYLSAISQYLLEEEGQTYGQEIKKDNPNN
jgi:hypothetical protein